MVFEKKSFILEFQGHVIKLAANYTLNIQVTGYSKIMYPFVPLLKKNCVNTRYMDDFNVITRLNFKDT